MIRQSIFDDPAFGPFPLDRDLNGNVVRRMITAASRDQSETARTKTFSC